ncbi:MAG: FIST C-terminal domain-containing protein, partial [Bacteroidia bacterium]|nr:FIST C-terminal domain-containing protein [Bacteroidia bacterium]
MLQFFSASTSIVNSKRAITECLENALEDQGSLDCDLIIIYSAIGHNFKEIISEAHKLSPNARIVGCTGAGIIGREGPNESLKALAIMAVKGPKGEFAIAGIKSTVDMDSFEIGARLAQDLKNGNSGINMIHFLPSGFGLWPADKAIAGIESIFGPEIPVFGGVSFDNMKSISSFQFLDDQVFEKGAVAIGFADSTLKILIRASHGFHVMEGLTLEVTKCEGNRIFEFNHQPAWKVLTNTLGLPETANPMDVLILTAFARILPEEFTEEYNSKHILSGIVGNNDDNSIMVPVACHEGLKIWLTKRDEKKMFDGVDHLGKSILDSLNGAKPVAVFHADCVLRGKLSLNKILKDEIINHMQAPICGGKTIPWLGLYSAGEFVRIGRKNFF